MIKPKKHDSPHRRVILGTLVPGISLVLPHKERWFTQKNTSPRDLVMHMKPGGVWLQAREISRTKVLKMTSGECFEGDGGTLMCEPAIQFVQGTLAQLTSYHNMNLIDKISNKKVQLFLCKAFNRVCLIKQYAGSTIRLIGQQVVDQLPWSKFMSLIYTVWKEIR